MLIRCKEVFRVSRTSPSWSSWQIQIAHSNCRRERRQLRDGYSILGENHAFDASFAMPFSIPFSIPFSEGCQTHWNSNRIYFHPLLGHCFSLLLILYLLSFVVSLSQRYFLEGSSLWPQLHSMEDGIRGYPEHDVKIKKKAHYDACILQRKEKMKKENTLCTSKPNVNNATGSWSDGG